jgi:16S rRNA (guanine966-N2)-methyltransferase
MRVIGGELRGKRLKTARGTRIRPTSDRVREAIFNILGNRLQGQRVLDLFAGAGALGIEALSRGAAEAVFVDRHPQSLHIIRNNIEQCRLASRARVLKLDLNRGVQGLVGLKPPFDLVFADPPYHRHNLLPNVLERLASSDLLVAGTLLVVEHSAKETFTPDVDSYVLEDRRRYGKTLVSFLRYMIV